MYRLITAAPTRPVVFLEDVQPEAHPVPEPPVLEGMIFTTEPGSPTGEWGLAPPAALVAVVVVGRRGRVVPTPRRR